MELFFYLFGAWLFGVLIRFGFSLAFDPNFTFSQNKFVILLSALIGLPVAFIAFKMNLGSWFVLIVLFLAGFLSQYGLEWLNKRKG